LAEGGGSVFADKVYHSNALRAAIVSVGMQAVIRSNHRCNVYSARN
jgi:hypothetical protein